MKLVFLNRYFFPDISATSQILTDLALDQAARGREVHVITSRQLYENPDATLAVAEEHRGIRIHRIWTTRFGRANLLGRGIDYATFYLSAAVRLLALTRERDVIVAKTDPPLISVVAAWVARRRGARLVNWLQDVFPEIAEQLGVEVFRGRLGRMARSLRTYSLRTAAMNVVLGGRMSSTVSQLAPALRVELIENWADGRLVRPIPSGANPLRAQWGLADRFVVGYSGNMGRAHEFDTVLAAAELLRTDNKVVFLFIGAGRQRERIEAEAVRRSLPNVAFRPYQTQELLSFSLSAADAHLVTLKHDLEGLIVPSKFYGIAAAGRPTIFVGDPDGEVAQAIKGEACGRVIEEGDAQGLATAIRQLRDEPEVTAEMGRRARDAFDRRWDVPVALARWDALLARVDAWKPGA